MTPDRHYCPACGAGLVSEPIGAPLRCKNCLWRLISLDAWRKMSPFQQGHLLYMQGAWPTSELAKEKNPYAEGTPEWTEFNHGERRAAIDAQDSEE
jgi:hypothetical protein